MFIYYPNIKWITMYCNDHQYSYTSKVVPIYYSFFFHFFNKNLWILPELVLGISFIRSIAIGNL